MRGNSDQVLIIIVILLTENRAWSMQSCMDKETVLAQRESGRISSFLRNMVEEGKITPFEQQLVKQEGQDLFRQAGYLDSENRLKAEMGNEAGAVQRQANYRQRQKIIELHPELEAALTRSIEHRQLYAAAKLTPLLEKPGVALAQYLELLDFIMDKRDRGAMTRDEAHAAYEPAIRLFEDEGISMGELSNQTDKAVLVKARQAVELKLQELRPEFAEEIRNLRAGRSK
jgi:hypothetical protein